MLMKPFLCVILPHTSEHKTPILQERIKKLWTSVAVLNSPIKTGKLFNADP